MPALRSPSGRVSWVRPECANACAPIVRSVEGIEIIGVSHLKDSASHFAGKSPIAPNEPVQYAELLSRREHSVDFCHVRGQKSAKRALEIAAAGGHNVLMIGPPGSGKTLMARCLPTILPDMTFQEALERCGMSESTFYRRLREYRLTRRAKK